MYPALSSSGSSGSSGSGGPILGPALTLGVVLLAGWSAESFAAPLDSASDKDDTPVVHTPQGDVVGVLSTSASGNKFMAFYGIPYAKPPTGDLRFKDPQPADKWEGVLAARREGHMCMQPTSPMKRFAYVMQKMAGLAKTLGRLPNVGRFAAKHMTQMSENCLFLNVYVPGIDSEVMLQESPPETPMPVLVFIHGGAFFMGSSDSMMYGADYLMDKGVVVVTLNYRLGPLGFLTTNSTDAPGNAGIKDQRLAMRWVRDNIRAFGGDPDRVTIYGESAGSYSVHMHVLSPGSKGLFRAAIMSSSMGPNFYGFRGDGSALSMRLAEALGADPDTAMDPAKRVKFLQGVPVRTLYDKMMSAVIQEKDLRTLSPVFPWALVPEPQDSEDPVLTRHPNDIMRDSSFNRVPIMVGLNDKEGSLLVPREEQRTRRTPKSRTLEY
ncbi:hypothetical protein ONE63_004040 [Megalurothrips usitatus]|uniref:Carboxylic ester hydrolase n=1 Tax=Megalurothrips usitatus TaxID=439358 RepID=A0AAV7XBW4_9NEOP|nr:hypothetical protein ONE63_004040 [Megalurothrips usitatus]